MVFLCAFDEKFSDKPALNHTNCTGLCLNMSFEKFRGLLSELYSYVERLSLGPTREIIFTETNLKGTN